MSVCPHPEKQRYSTAGAAKKAAAVVREKRDLSPDLKAYKCACGWFHVGHSVSSLRFRIREARRNGVS